MYLFTAYVFHESVDSAHNSQISSTFQEADCLLKLVKINKQVYAITLLSRNLNHTAQLSISARGGIIILSVGLGGGGERKRPFHCIEILLYALGVVFHHSPTIFVPRNTLCKERTKCVKESRVKTLVRLNEQ